MFSTTKSNVSPTNFQTIAIVYPKNVPQKCPQKNSQLHFSHYFPYMWFPEMGVPPVIILFHGIFHYKPTIFGYPHGNGNTLLRFMNYILTIFYQSLTI